jgi:uncharacterized protein YaaW (UPF0174 family)
VPPRAREDFESKISKNKQKKMDKSSTQKLLEDYLDNRVVMKALERQLRIARAEQFLLEKNHPWLKSIEGQLEKQEEEDLKKNPPNPL